MKALLTDINKPLSTRLFADSAITRSGNPLFVPDSFAPWQGSVCMAVRIGRLGKCIAEKFAMRYVDAITAVHVMQSAAAGELTYIADSAVIHGDSLALGSIADTFELSVTDGTGTSVKTCTLAELNIPAMIAGLSRLATFKTGDLIIFSSTSVPTNLENSKDKYIEAVIDGCRCIKFKVK